MQVLGTANGQDPGREEQEAMQMLQQFFTYAAQNPQLYPQMRAHMIQEDMVDPQDLPEQMDAQQLQAAAGAMQQLGAGGRGLGDALASMGRRGDSMMAHINPQEAQLLQAVGGSGSVNPMTGQPEYFKKFFKKVLKPLIGAAIGFALAPVTGGLSLQLAMAGLGASGGYALQKQGEIAQAQSRGMQERNQLEQGWRDEETERKTQAEINRQNNINESLGIVSQLFGQFNDDFFKQRSQSYSDFARPQLDRQYNDAMQELVRALARGGNLQSSERGRAMADLRGQYDKGLLSIADQGNRFANDARSSIESARSNLISQAGTLGDPGLVRSMAETQASFLAANNQGGFSPLQTLITALSRAPGSNLTAGGQPLKTREPTGVSLFGSAPSVATGSTVG